MNVQKTHTHPKKLLLYELQHIVKALYPRMQTQNPYEDYLQSYYQALEIKDTLLFKNILSCITILNHKERVLEKSYYMSSFSDVLMAIELFSDYHIGSRIIQTYHSLKDTFNDDPFTKLDAIRLLKRSATSMRRDFIIFTDLQLIEKLDQKQGPKALYRLTTHRQTPHYQQAISQWHDHNGWVDLQHRT